MTKSLGPFDDERAFTETVAVLLRRVSALETVVSTLGPGQRRTFAPSVTFGGSGTNVSSSGVYWFDGDEIAWEMSWSTSGAVNVGRLGFSVPVAHVSNPGTPGTMPNPTIGTAVLLDASVQRYRAFAVLDDSTTACALDYGFGAGQVFVSGTAPFTPGGGDKGHASGRYRWR